MSEDHVVGISESVNNELIGDIKIQLAISKEYCSIYVSVNNEIKESYVKLDSEKASAIYHSLQISYLNDIKEKITKEKILEIQSKM